MHVTHAVSLHQRPRRGHMPLCSVTCRVPSCHHLAVTARRSGGGEAALPTGMWLCPPPLQWTHPPMVSVPEFLVGNLVVTQNTSLPWPSSYLTKTVLKVSFLLHDPSNFFKTASFLYSWDFGDGYVLIPLDAPKSWLMAGGPVVPGGVLCTLPSSPSHSLSLQTCLVHLLCAKLGVHRDQCEPVMGPAFKVPAT